MSLQVNADLTNVQGSKQVLSSRPGQVDFPSGESAFHCHLPNGQGARQVLFELKKKKSKQRFAKGKASKM